MGLDYPQLRLSHADSLSQEGAYGIQMIYISSDFRRLTFKSCQIIDDVGASERILLALPCRSVIIRASMLDACDITSTLHRAAAWELLVRIPGQ